MNEMYTGRRIAIFSDVHAFLEPLAAIIEDIEKLGIIEIYSLGNNIGIGPSPSEVIDMIDYYNIKSIAGMFEEYCTLGINTYGLNFVTDILKNYEWTLSNLGDERCNFIRNFPHSFDLEVGGKKIALCYFANDIRTNHSLYNVKTYLDNLGSGEAYKQFLYNNSAYHKETILYNLDKYSNNRILTNWYTSAIDYPVFDGKLVTEYDAIIQGCVHKNIFDQGANVEFYTIGSCSLSFNGIINDLAFYIILHEKTNNMGFDIEKRYVNYDKKSLKDSIFKSTELTGKIKKLNYVK